MVERSNLGHFSHIAYNASFQRSGKVLIPPLQTRSLRNPHNQKSQSFKSGEREGHASGKYLDNHDYPQISTNQCFDSAPNVRSCSILHKDSGL
ncbi:hypothetical protein TNCV_2264171 [Trichonephila clavipes]|nr:hypothetical protein TNCV_2264171 [Trichonephila clavipes]